MRVKLFLSALILVACSALASAQTDLALELLWIVFQQDRFFRRHHQSGQQRGRHD